jgi:16S rRNA (guanine527-N7)-methyltransferase
MSEADLPESLEAAARVLFRDRLPLACRYADLLAVDGVVRGLIGPREVPRLWDRHLLNCAALTEIIPYDPPGLTIVDVGTGAGLPGIVLAMARPDLRIVLVEPLARRTTFLTEAVADLGLDAQVDVVRGRADEVPLSPVEIVTARAVAPLDRLAAWCLPLVAVGGRLLALKGASAADEVAAHRDEIERLGGGAPVVRQCGVELLDPPTTVVEITRERSVPPSGKGSPARPAARSRRDPTGSGRGRARRG